MQRRRKEPEWPGDGEPGHHKEQGGERGRESDIERDHLSKGPCNPQVITGELTSKRTASDGTQELMGSLLRVLRNKEGKQQAEKMT